MFGHQYRDQQRSPGLMSILTGSESRQYNKNKRKPVSTSSSWSLFSRPQSSTGTQQRVSSFPFKTAPTYPKTSSSFQTPLRSTSFGPRPSSSFASRPGTSFASRPGTSYVQGKSKILKQGKSKGSHKTKYCACVIDELMSKQQSEESAAGKCKNQQHQGPDVKFPRPSKCFRMTRSIFGSLQRETLEKFALQLINRLISTILKI